MRNFLLILFTLLTSDLLAQDTSMYRDTVNHFQIDVPGGWIIGPRFKEDPPGVSVRLKRIDEGGVIPSYHVSITGAGNLTLEKFYTYGRPLDSPNEDRVLIEEGDYSANGIRYKWFLAKSKTMDGLRTLIYFCYKDGKFYELSFSTDLHNYLKYVATFKKVVDTFKFLDSTHYPS